MRKLFSRLLLMVLAAGIVRTGVAENMIQVKGSDTMVHLVSAWAESFMRSNPGISVSVTGGGSGTGASGLLNGTADIANMSRPMKDSEKNAAKGKGFEAVEHIVGLDGIAVIVHPSNPLKSLTMAQVRQIFTGEVSNWKTFGGPNAKILVFTRDSSSGTFAFFQEHVLNLGDYSVKARRLASNAAIVQSVGEDVNGIGYVGMGFLPQAKGKVRDLPIAADNSKPAVIVSNETVKNSSYPISRGLQMYTRNQPAGDVKRFMDFIKGPEGQKIVEEMGFVSIQ